MIKAFKSCICLTSTSAMAFLLFSVQAKQFGLEMPNFPEQSCQQEQEEDTAPHGSGVGPVPWWGQRTDPRGGHQHCQDGAKQIKNTGWRTTCSLGSLRYRRGVAKHTVSVLHSRISLSNEGAEMQEVLLSVSFNHRKKRTYGFVTLVYHTSKLFLHPLACSIHRLTLGILGAGQPPKYTMAFAAQCCSAIRLFSSLSELKSH